MPQLSSRSVNEKAFAEALHERLLKEGFPVIHLEVRKIFVDDIEVTMRFVSVNNKPRVIKKLFQFYTWLHDNLREAGNEWIEELRKEYKEKYPIDERPISL